MPLLECGEGGYKWGENGQCFIGPGAKEKALEIGKAIKAADKGVTFDVGTTLKATVSDSTGFLTAPVNLARTGVQYYHGYELGLAERALDKVGVFRSPEEVFSKASIDSFVNLVVTDDHPEEMVDTNNVKSLQVGSVSQVEKRDSVLTGVITITDINQISKIKNGKVQVSVGYSNDLKPLQGNFNGDDYEFIQTNIRANHLAIVDAGRCGAACKLTVDKKGKELTVKITIDGIEFDVADKSLAQAIEKQQKNHDAEAAEFKKKMSKAEEEKEEAMKEKDKAKAQADALQKDRLTADDLSKLIGARAVLIADAKIILGDKMPACVDCPMDIKTLVVDKVLPNMDLVGKSNDYIDAAYDMALAKVKAADGSIKNLAKDFEQGKKETTKDRESAREKYMQDQLGLKE